MEVSLAQFVMMYPRLPQSTQVAYHGHFQAACRQEEINTPKRLAMFFANLSAESGHLLHNEESFAYGADRLFKVYPAHFKTFADAVRYAKAGPVAIANHVYANRMGNGDEASGDGHKYRGRCPIMITGFNNYFKYGAKLDLPLTSKPEMAADMKYGALISACFFRTVGCNAQADLNNFDHVCDLINIGHLTAQIGDSIGYEERFHLLQVMTGVFA